MPFVCVCEPNTAAPPRVKKKNNSGPRRS
jgi:hypothetical protein